jgi:hypothetical protein
MSDAEYIKQLEAENELLKKEISKYLEENWQSSPTLGLSEEYYTRVQNAVFLANNGKTVKCISREFKSLRSLRDFIKSQALLYKMYIMFDEKEQTIYHKTCIIIEKMVPPQFSYILRFGVSAK